MLRGLSRQVSMAFDNVIETLLHRADAEAVFLCNEAGQVLASRMTRGRYERDTLAALAAGSFFATREIARLVGEPEFRCVMHQGASKGIYIQNMKLDLLLVVIFGADTNAGLIKLCAETLCEGLDRRFRRGDAKAAMDEPLAGIQLNVRQGSLFERA